MAVHTDVYMLVRSSHKRCWCVGRQRDPSVGSLVILSQTVGECQLCAGTEQTKMSFSRFILVCFPQSSSISFSVISSVLPAVIMLLFSPVRLCMSTLVLRTLELPEVELRISIFDICVSKICADVLIASFPMQELQGQSPGNVMANGVPSSGQVHLGGAWGLLCADWVYLKRDVMP